MRLYDILTLSVQLTAEFVPPVLISCEEYRGSLYSSPLLPLLDS